MYLLQPEYLLELVILVLGRLTGCILRDEVFRPKMISRLGVCRFCLLHAFYPLEPEGVPRRYRIARGQARCDEVEVRPVPITRELGSEERRDHCSRA